MNLPKFPSWHYTRAEIVADAVVHGLGIAAAIPGAILLVMLAVNLGDGGRFASVAIYIAALLAMLGISAAYNLWPVSPLKWKLRRFDHSAIYLLIAGTYTAMMLPLTGLLPTLVLTLIWVSAAIGIAIKLIWPGRFDRLSIALFIAMGWSGIVLLEPLVNTLSPAAIWLIVGGGALYSLGVIFHVWEKLRFQNVIWHGFVLAASLCHYVAVAVVVSA